MGQWSWIRDQRRIPDFISEGFTATQFQTAADWLGSSKIKLQCSALAYRNVVVVAAFEQASIVELLEPLREADGSHVAAHLQGHVDDAEEEPKITDDSILAIQTVLRVASVVAVGIGES